MLNLIIVITISYLIGAIPFSFIFSKLFTGIDPRKAGSGNVGATNVLVSTGKRRTAILSVFFDIVKGFAVVIFAKIFFGADIYIYLAAFFAIVGHDFPVYLNFKGGKGVATTTGVLIAINPFAIWFCVIAYIISISITRYVILSSLISIAIIPFILWMLGDGILGVLFGILCFTLALYVHKEDIERLISGSERKLSDAIKTVN